MGQDWFQVVPLMDGRTYLEGSTADQTQVCRLLTIEEAARVEALQAKHDHAMSRLLRELAA